MRYVGTLHKEIGTDFTQKTQHFKVHAFDQAVSPAYQLDNVQAIACPYQHPKAMCYLGTLRDAWHSENVR